MNIWGAECDRMYMPLRHPYSDNDPAYAGLTYIPLGFPTLIDSRELDRPCYTNDQYTLGFMSDNNDHSTESDDPEDKHGANHEDDHQSRRYDRTTLLTIAERMEALQYRLVENNVQHLLNPPPGIQTISYREPYLWKTLESQGCYEHPSDSDTTEEYYTPVQGGFFTGSAAETSGGSAAAGDQSACEGIQEVVFGRTGGGTYRLAD